MKTKKEIMKKMMELIEEDKRVKDIKNLSYGRGWYRALKWVMGD